MGTGRARPIGATAVAALVLLTPAPARTAEAGVPPATIEVLYHADLDGRLGALRCRSGSDAPVRGGVTEGYGALVGAISRARAQARAGPPIVLLGGNQAAPDLFARELLARGPAGARALAALFVDARYDGIALGHHDLSLDRASLDALLATLADHGSPAIVTNLRCDPARRGVCPRVERERIVRRGDLAVGLMAVISPSVVPAIPAGRLDGLDLEDPVTAVRSAIERLRARGAGYLILMTQGPRDVRSLGAIEALQRRLAEGPAPDLVLAGGLADEETGRALRLLRRDGAPPVVGAPTGAAGLTRVLATVDGLTEVEGVAAEPEHPDPAVAARLAPLETAICQRAAEPLSPAPLLRPLGREDLIQLVLELMRRRTEAEIAVVNRAYVRRSPFPMTGRVTRGDFSRALPYRAVLGFARVPGATVEGLLGPALDNPKAAIAGLARTGGRLQVNGRPLDKARAYRVATIDFVVDGGDGILPKGTLRLRAEENDLRALVEAALEAGAASAADLGPSPAERALFVGTTDVGLDLASTAISNAAGYGDAQLVRAQQASLKGDATAVGLVRHPRHEADGRLALKYGWARTQPTGQPATSGETADLVTATALYSYRGLRDWRRLPRPAIPDPYLRLWVESELTRPALTATQPRDFHHLELRATAGAQLTLTPRWKLRGGAGARKELLTAADPGGWQPLLEAGTTLDPIALATFGPLAVRLEGLLDYHFLDPQSRREHQFRGSTKLSVPLVPTLFLTVGLDLFAVQRQGLGWARSFDTTVGLRVHLDTAHQHY
jgi:5'-nucleotidase / UDP-sugar diphosphatase